VSKITSDTQTRKWQLTINNPNENGYTRNWIKEILGSYKALVYWCMADEVGECGTYHTHIYLSFSSAVRFSTMKKKFPSAHIEMCQGTSQQNRDYIFKQGKWEKDKKKETHLAETREEYGQMPIERPGTRNDIVDMMDMVKKGMSDLEIIEEFPRYFMQMDKIDKYRQKYKEDEFKKVHRKLEVTYIYGRTGAGKTRGVMDKYGYENVYMVTDYAHPFDGYKNQDVILFEEFYSSLRIQDMLKYLDGYPLELPCRYSNKIACFTKVYIISNISLGNQYENIQKEYPETWKAFIRRIHLVKEYTKSEVVEHTLSQELWWQDIE